MGRVGFVREIREYQDGDGATLDKAYKILLTIQRTHPFAMERAHQLDLWHTSGYSELLAAHP